MAYEEDKNKCNYIHQLLRMQDIMGQISQAVLVHTHVFNRIPPEAMEFKVRQLQVLAEVFLLRYRKEQDMTEFDMQH